MAPAREKPDFHWRLTQDLTVSKIAGCLPPVHADIDVSQTYDLSFSAVLHATSRLQSVAFSDQIVPLRGGMMREPRLRAWRLARAARRAGGLPAIAKKADDLEEIKKSVEDAASVSGGLWLSYLFVLFYIAIAAGAVTHEDLLLERSVKLPFLNVELALLAFFVLAPFIVLIVHAYALMHFIMLGKKASSFHNELRRQFPDSETDTQKSGVSPDSAQKDIRDKLRRLLPSNIFVQNLAGPPELRTGIFGSMLKLIAVTTLVIFPI